jgi:hypothetical protein
MTDYEPSAEQKKNQPLFNLVANRENWKMPIDALVDPAALKGISWNDLGKAVTFYTGSVATITWKQGQVHVTAAGYYAAIGA